MSNTLSSIALPEPDSAAQSLSQRLQEQIRQEILSLGPMSYARYMELALYSPGLGYYRNGSQKFGADGDFTTAPELSPLFAECIAKQCRQILTSIQGGDILEFGAGSGIMAAGILQTLAALDALPNRYYILEVSAELRQRQQSTLHHHAQPWIHKVIWLDRLPEHPLQGVILANEVLDALPVHCFGYYQKLQEYYVCLRDQKFAWQLGPLSSTVLEEQLKNLNIDFADGYRSEINLLLPGWIASLSNILAKGLVLLTDYGLTRSEYYHPDRECGTLLCHYRHRAHDNPFWWPGLQDLTAQVDFTAVAIAADAYGFEVSGYTHQAAFLLNCGITDCLANVNDAQQQLTLSRQIQRLTMPGEMGEPCKAMALTKNYDKPLIGFETMNQVARL